MHRSLLVVLCLATPSLALAQNSQCSSLSTVGNARQACDAAVDMVRAYHPLAGLAITGGNPVIGSPAAWARFGAVSLALRANGFSLSVPDLATVSGDGTVQQSDELLAPVPVVEASVGVFRGLEGGLLALDLLGSVQFVPNEEAAEEIRVDPDAPRIGPVSLGFGIGARVGVRSESAGLPGVAVSIMRRGIPRVGYGDLAAGDDIAADVTLAATSIRATAGKQLGPAALTAGAGWSRYSGDALAAYDVGVGPGEQGTIDLALSQDRWLVFANAGLQLGPMAIVGELGHQFGHDQGLGTTFVGYDDAGGTTFGSAALRVSF